MSAGYNTGYNTVPIFFQSSIPFSKSNLHGTFNKQKEKKNSVTFQTKPFLQIPSTNYQKISKDRQAQKKRTEEKEKINK